jgi:hypothetical protein
LRAEDPELDWGGALRRPIFLDVHYVSGRAQGLT